MDDSLFERATKEYKRNGLSSVLSGGINLAYFNTIGQILGEERSIGLNHQLKRHIKYKSISPNRLITNQKTKTYQIADCDTFFGYYDVSPYNEKGNKLLACLLRKNSSKLIVGYFDISTDEYTVVDQTLIWSWQQGCRLQWMDKKHVIFNSHTDSGVGADIYDVKNDTIARSIDSPIYQVSSDGSFAVSFNFARLGRLRKGYGYNNVTDKTKNDNAPSNEGLWKIDLNSGSRKLLVSLSELARYKPETTMNNAQHYINHAFLNNSGELAIFLHRWKSEKGRNSRLLSVDCRTSDIQLIEAEGEPSHMCWKSYNEVLATINYGRRTKYYLYDLESGKKYHKYEDLESDGHPSYSPQGDLITDTRPNKLGERKLCLINSQGDIHELGRVFNPWTDHERCDLHPRWNKSGTKVCVDIYYGNVRKICEFDVSNVGSR